MSRHKINRIDLDASSELDNEMSTKLGRPVRVLFSRALLDPADPTSLADELTAVVYEREADGEEFDFTRAPEINEEDIDANKVLGLLRSAKASPAPQDIRVAAVAEARAKVDNANTMQEMKVALREVLDLL